jgi:hypothetical protein
MNSLSSGYRRFIWRWWKHYLSPRTYYYYFKYKIQRANRGWADCDIWSLDNYLAEWIPDALKRLKDVKHGIPMEVFPTDPQYIDHTGNATDEAMKIASKTWDEILGKMIAGFEAYNRIQDTPQAYETEIGEFPDVPFTFESNGDGTSRWVKTPEEDDALDTWMAKERPLIERDQKIWEEGAGLFIKYFGSLWD